MISTSSLVRRVLRSLLAVGAVAVLAGCGGGTSQRDPFIAERVFAFGDETSTLTATGAKYSVNSLATDLSLDCAVQPIWVQAVANLYAVVFAECNPDNVTPKAFMQAAPGAMVADLATQIDAAEAAPGFDAKTIATVMMGANDVFALYAEYPARSESELVAELGERGRTLAAQVNRLVDRSVRVLIATVPDLGLTPFALAQKAAHTDTDRAALLSRMTAALNAGIRINVVNDGRKLALVLGDEMVQAMVRSASFFSLSNVVDAACLAPLPTCANDTLVTDASSAAWLWADDRHLAFGGQNRLGLLARDAAVRNPF